MVAQDMLFVLEAYGADIPGIKSRFMGDMELYIHCFEELLREPCFDVLEKAMADKDYNTAFEAAHTLKGITGNLGLTPFYDAVCILVELLREKVYVSVPVAYAAVLQKKAQLEVLGKGETPLPQQTSLTAPAETPKTDAASEAKKANRAFRRNMIVFTVSLSGLVLCAVLLFTNLINSYLHNVLDEGANHLLEIAHQMSIYVQEEIDKDWKSAYSISNSLQASSDTANVLAYLARERDVWELSDIIVYTENGVAVNPEGVMKPNDEASDTLYYAHSQGEYLSIVSSSLSYTIPVETDLEYEGSKISAISVVQNMHSFLDNMGFLPFGGAGHLYLTSQDGAVISRLSNQPTSESYNIMALLQEGTLTALVPTDGDPDKTLTSLDITAYMHYKTGEDWYVISAPISTRRGNLLLFYMVPENVVNRNLNDFSVHLSVLSILVIVVFSVFALSMLLLVYRQRKRQFDKALLERERMFDLLVDNTSTVFALFTPNAPKLQYISANCERLLGVRNFMLVKAENGYRIKSEGGGESPLAAAANEKLSHWDGKTPFHSGYLPFHNENGAGFFEAQVYPLSDSSEFVGIAQDVTRRYEREQATKVALEMANRSNAARERFLSNMSHDMRTPMNAIVNMTAFALESIGKPEIQRPYLETIQESSSHLLQLVNDVLDMSRIESGQVVLDSEPFDLRADLKRLQDIITPLAAAKGQTLYTYFGGLDDTVVMGDQTKVLQILMNLLSNAVKFTPKGGELRFTATDLPSLSERLKIVRFVVEDSGIGISKKDLEHVFEPFTRADDKRVSGIEGTGLGLSICKSYVAAMGGSIVCESLEDIGSTFTVELPFPKSAVQEVRKSTLSAAPSKAAVFQGKRCLLCEDNRVNRLVGGKILRDTGFLVEMAENGREGLNRFTASAEGYYDLIYMDIRMPVMDGYETAAAIRVSNHPQAKTIPIIAMTANVFAEDIEKSRLVGMDGHLGKPIIVGDLVEETLRLLHMNGGNI